MSGAPLIRERVPVLSLGAVVIAVPLTFDPWGWAAFGPVKWMAVTVLGFVAVAAAASRRSISLHVPSALGWLAFLGWGVVAAVVAVDPFHAWTGTPDRHLGLLAWALFALLFLVAQHITSVHDVRTVLRAAVVAGAGIGFYVLLELAGLAPVELLTNPDRPGGPFGTPAFLGAAGAMLLPIVIGAVVDGLASKRWQWFGAGSALLLGIAVFASGTRAGWVGLAAAAVAAFPAVAPILRRRPWIPALGLAVLAVALFVTPMGSRIGDAFDFESGTARGRLDEWQVGAAVLVEHPVSGVGFEGYRIVFAGGVDAEYERRYGRQVMPDRAHNGLLDVGVTMGIPGMVLYAAGAVWLIFRGIGAIRTRRAWLVGVGSGVIGYIVQQQFLFPITEFDPVFWVLAGILVAATSGGNSVTMRLPPGTWLVAVALAAGAFVAGGLDVAADHAAADAQARSAGGNHAAALIAADRAVALRPDSIRYGVVAATVAAVPGTPDALETAIDRLDAALQHSPLDPVLRAENASLRLRLVTRTGNRAVLEEATLAWAGLVADDPHHARYRLEYGIALALGGNTIGAEREWLTAADLAPDSVAPPTNLARLYLDAGNAAAAAVQIDRLRSLDSLNPALPELDRRLNDLKPY
jgi:O-antigen ligase